MIECFLLCSRQRPPMTGGAGDAGGAVGALRRAASCPRHARAPESRQVLGLTGLIGQGLHSESGQREAGRASAEIENFVSDLPTDGARGLT
jgi:hypothetical protein